MCGISGIISRNGGDDLDAVIRRINGAMPHRGPDADGFYVAGELALGHRRLSILDLSSAANQPFTDASGRYITVFNGEIYNFQEIKESLKEYPFKTTGDTEVLIAAYAKWGPACLERLRGMFAIAIWDKVEKSLFLARDRFGVKPLYLFQDKSRLLFASEIRALLASGVIPRKLDRNALVDYLKYQSFVTPRTIIEGVTELRAGTYVVYRDGTLVEKVYWDITRVRQPIVETSLAKVHQRIKELMYQSVERRLVSDVPLGAFLSGGIDSSLVVAIMSKVNRSATNAFTISFEEQQYDESPYAELVAKKFGVNHTKVLLRPQDFLDRLPEALNALDVPSGDGLNTYVVSQAIRKSGIVVALSGIGGDELFAGYPIFKQFQQIKRSAGIFDRTLLPRKAAAALLPSTNRKYAQLKQLLRSPSSGIADIYPVFRGIHNSHSLSRLLCNYRDMDGGALEDYLAVKEPEINQFGYFSQVSIADYLGYTQSVLLKDADQMSMASSLELREPFFDNDLVEYVLNVPDDLKYPRFPKSLLVESVGDLLPQEIVFRKKQGFVLPYDVWLRKDLKDFCDSKVRSLAGRGIFSEQALLKYWDDFLQQNSNIRWADFWVLVVLENWLENNGVSA